MVRIELNAVGVFGGMALPIFERQRVIVLPSHEKCTHRCSHGRAASCFKRAACPLIQEDFNHALFEKYAKLQRATASSGRNGRGTLPTVTLLV